MKYFTVPTFEDSLVQLGDLRAVGSDDRQQAHPPTSSTAALPVQAARRSSRSNSRAATLAMRDTATVGTSAAMTHFRHGGRWLSNLPCCSIVTSASRANPGIDNLTANSGSDQAGHDVDNEGRNNGGGDHGQRHHVLALADTWHFIRGWFLRRRVIAARSRFESVAGSVLISDDGCPHRMLYEYDEPIINLDLSPAVSAFSNPSPTAARLDRAKTGSW
jgi:hypothetical protein